MMTNRRWPTPQEIVEEARRGVIDDGTDAIPIFDLEEDEVTEIERRARELERQQQAS